MAMSNILKLKPAFSDEQAQALAALFDEELATKTDLERLKVELRADIDRLRLEVERDIKASEVRVIGWVVGQGAALAGIVFALLHFKVK